MKRYSLFASALVLTLLSASGFGFANNYSFLNTSPMHYFHGADTKMMTDNIEHALDQGKDNQKFSWSNPRTGSWGYAIPSNSRKQDGFKCRYLKILNNSRHVEDVSHYNFCRIDGHWKIVSHYH